MDGFLAVTVYLAAIVYAKVHDPLAWCMIAIVAIMSAQRHPFWRVLIVVFCFAAANVALLYRWWIESGLGFHPWRVGNILFGMTVIGIVAYGLGRLLGWALPRLAGNHSS